MDEEIVVVRKELEAVREEIKKVQQEIKEVKEQIVSVEQRLNERGLSKKDTAYFREEKKQLRDKEDKLRDKENKLLDEKNKLRDKENKLRDADAVAQGPGLVSDVGHPEHNSLLLRKLERIEEAVLDDKTKNKSMSQASAAWAETILAAHRVKHVRGSKVVYGVGSLKDPPPYKWTVETSEGETWDKSEHGGTPGAVLWLKKNLLEASAGCPFDLKVVTGAMLPKVKGNRRSATGKTDILIGQARDIQKGSTFDFAMGIVELKTDKYPLKIGQNLLELFALSMASAFKKAVVLLATDCGAKWEVFFFSDSHTIKSKVYDHGSRAWDDFLQLLGSADDRAYVDNDTPMRPSLPQVAEQDLTGFEETERDQKKAKAEQDEALLEHFADRMAELYGERPIVPWWAHANAKIPDYYG